MPLRTVALIALGLFALHLPTASLAADESLEALNKRVESLEQRVTALERELAQAKTTAAADPAQLEREAATEFNRINSLVAAGKMDQAKSQLDQFMSKYSATQAARRAAGLQRELAVIGKPAPASWGIEKWYLGEGDVELGSGLPTLVVFWEEWCPHCKREVPKVQQYFDVLHPEGLQVVALTKITRSSTERKVLSFLAEKGVSYPVAKENGQASAHFAVSGIPAAAVLKDGKVVWRGHPGRLSMETLRGWL